MGFFEVFAALLVGFYAVIPSYGLAIILLTLTVRIVLLPLSIKQTRSQREMQRIMPEVKALQKKHKGDRQKINEATMALYKEHGVNPLGGCLPLLMQFPVLIALFYVIRRPLAYMGYALPEGTGRGSTVPPSDYIPRDVSGILRTMQHSDLAEGLRHATLKVNGFLGLRLDCSSSASIQNQDPSAIGHPCGNGIVDALPYLLLVVLMGATTYYMQKQMQARGPAADAQAQQMQMFTKIMPVMLMFFAYSFPAGVVIYWLTTNVWTIVQQRIMLRVVPHEPVGGAPSGGKGGKTPSGAAGGGKSATAKPKKGTPAKGAGEDGQRSPTRASKPNPSRKKKR